jgi:hypothetical protein
VVARWEGTLNIVRMQARLDQENDLAADEPESGLPAPEPLLPQASSGPARL